MVDTDVPAHSHIECDFWISTFWWRAVRQPILICLFWFFIRMTSGIIRSESPKLLRAKRHMYCLYHIYYPASYQFSHAALLSHSILTLVVEAHLAGFAAEAMLCRVSCQEHHMLGCCTWETHGKEATGSDLSCQELDLNGVPKWTAYYTQKGRGNGKYCSERCLIHLFIVFTHLFLAESFWSRSQHALGENLWSDMWNILQNLANATHDVHFCKTLFTKLTVTEPVPSSPFQTAACVWLTLTY